jgi:hypothetical protein
MIKRTPSNRETGWVSHPDRDGKLITDKTLPARYFPFHPDPFRHCFLAPPVDQQQSAQEIKGHSWRQTNQGEKENQKADPL